jgi:hypothetical protein
VARGTQLRPPAAPVGGEQLVRSMGFEDITVAIMKIVFFCKVINIHQNITGTFCLHLHCGNLMDIKQMIN